MSTRSSPRESGHRFYPNQWYPTWIRFSHETRYEWAASMVKERRVLDGACGTGYGTSLLRRAGADYVEGVDLSEESVEEAEARYGGPGIRFTPADLVNLGHPDETFDVVVSFESIEHVKDDGRYVAEMRRVLRRGGIFLCSTPNRAVTNPGTAISTKPYNPFHVREYTINELRAKLRTEFDNVSIMGQMPWPASYCARLAALARWSPMVAVRVHQARKVLGSPLDRKGSFAPAPLSAGSEPEGLVAVCS